MLRLAEQRVGSWQDWWLAEGPCGTVAGAKACLPSPFPAGLWTFHAKSSGQPGPLFRSWPTRERPLGLRGPKIALVFLARPSGQPTCGGRSQPQPTAGLAGVGPRASVPAFAKGLLVSGEESPLQIWGAGDKVTPGRKIVLFWLWFHSSTPVRNWKQLCSPYQSPKSC